MVKGALIRGLNDNKGRPMPDKMPFLNFTATTGGEFDALTAKQRLWILRHLQPEKDKIWDKGAMLVDNTLFHGLHGKTPYFGSLPSEIQFVARALTAAKEKTGGASDMMFRASNDIRKGLDLDSVQGIYDNIEDFRRDFPNCFRGYWDSSRNTWVKTNEVVQDCQHIFNFCMGFNDTIPKTAHHSIYHFTPTEELNDRTKHTQISVHKTLNHKDFFGGMQIATKMHPQSLSEWLKNCVIWRNSNAGMTSNLTPESNINLIRSNPNWNLETIALEETYLIDRVGFCLEVFTCAAFVLILVVISFKGIGGLIQICRNKEPSAFAGLTEIAQSLNFGASGTDFKGLGTGTGGGTGGGGTGENKTCDEGYTYDETLKKCVKDEPSGGVMDWIKENPLTSAAAAIGTGILGYELLKK